MPRLALQGPTDSVIDPKTFMPKGIGGSPLLDITPFQQGLRDDVVEWLDETMPGQWMFKFDPPSQFGIYFNNDAHMNWFVMRWL